MGLVITTADAEAGAAGRLVGRIHERRLLDGLIESVEGGGAAALIVGEAGTGKTALLTHVAEVASNRVGLRVLRARGEESEAGLAFAALADMLLPLRERFTELPPAQRHALEGCLALSGGSSESAGKSQLGACAGTLRVLASVAAEHPVAVLVDDLQWVDPESRQILLFAAHRLAAERVVMILAVRDEPGAPPPELGLQVLRLGGLSVTECADLARRLGADISPPALRSLVELTGGNPLAVLENLPAAAAGPAGPAGPGGIGAIGVFEPARLTLGRVLEHAWGRLFAELPEDTQRALFVVATDGVSGGCHVEAALGRLQLSLADLAPAECRGLVRTTDGEIRLRHPLLRPVIVERTPLGVRAAACRALAGVTGGHQQAWYLAAAATGPDEAVARALADAAGQARQHGGYGASARTWRRAAELTADHALRARHLLRAAADAHLAGDPGTAAAWSEEALTQGQDPVFAAEAQQTLGRARTWASDPLPAFDGLVRAAAAIRPVSRAWAVALLAEATVPAAMAGRADLVRQIAEQADELRDDTDDTDDTGPANTLTVVTMIARAFLMTGELDRAEPYRRKAQDLLPAADLAAELPGAAFLAQDEIWAERYEQARHHLGAVLDCARRMGAPAIASLALGLSGELGWWTGRWASAYADATESLQRAREIGQAGLIGYGLTRLARIEAARGDRERCEEHVQQARREVEPRGTSAVGHAAALGLCALSRGELTTAIDHLEQAWDTGLAGRLGNPNVVPFAGDLAEALARAGAAARAGPVVTWLQERADATGLAYPRAAAARARGILAGDPDEAEAWFARARSAHQDQPMPFEQARTLLCQGEALRRARRPAASRRPLHRALTIFNGLGAQPWAARAMTELAATGARAGNGASAPALDALSPQELQVARAVGRGLNNVEAAAALFVSRKTVEAHLTRAYRKLGVRSRTELARLLLTRDVTRA
jgi:DNA-binding CsgD family transcriptional regulator